MVPLRVVIVDDHPDVLEAFELSLRRRRDVQVVAAVSDGRQAVEVCERGAADLVLLDYHMGQFDGGATAREVKNRFPAVIIVGMSSANDVRETMIAAGADYFFSKGDVLDELPQVLRDARQRRTPDEADDAQR